MKSPEFVVTIYMHPRIGAGEAAAKIKEWAAKLDIPSEFGDLDISVEEIFNYD